MFNALKELFSIPPGEKEVESGAVPYSYPEVEDFNPKSGRLYVVLGGKAEDILTTCDSCAGPYQGHLQPRCEFCGTARKVYYIDVTDTKTLDSVSPKTLEHESSLRIFDSNKVVLGGDSRIDRVVAEEVKAANFFNCRIVIAGKFETGELSRFETVIVLDGGSATFGKDSAMNLLIAGRKTQVNFGRNCHVGVLRHMGDLSYTAELGFGLNFERRISYPDFLKMVADKARIF